MYLSSGDIFKHVVWVTDRVVSGCHVQWYFQAGFQDGMFTGTFRQRFCKLFEESLEKCFWLSKVGMLVCHLFNYMNYINLSPRYSNLVAINLTIVMCSGGAPGESKCQHVCANYCRWNCQWVFHTSKVEGHCLFWIDDCRQFLVTFRQLLGRVARGAPPLDTWTAITLSACNAIYVNAIGGIAQFIIINGGCEVRRKSTFCTCSIFCALVVLYVK